MSVVDLESSILKTPEWLEVLENKRKRPHKLAHEIGAGAPCLVCKEKCKGLNLHFWRKLCIECKCKKEDHEVEEEDDYAQFEILFGVKKVKRTTLKFNAQNKLFDWIPPNVPPELVVDYLKSIPQSKLPISNTDGARYRKQQLEKQLPLHDVDPNACHNLSAKETQEFQKYIENLKNNVIGQGKIMKYLMPQEMLKEKYIHGTLVNMTVSSEKYDNLKPQGVELCGHLTIDKLPGYSAFSQPLKFESYPVQEFNTNSNQYSQLINSTAQTCLLRPLPTKLENLNLKNHNQFGKFSNTATKGPKPFLATSFDHKNDGQIKNCEESINGVKGTLGLRTPSSFIDRKYPLADKQNNNQNTAHQDNNCNDNSADVSIVGNLSNSCESSKACTSESLNTKEFGGFGNKFQSCDAIIQKDPLEQFRELNVSSRDVAFVPVQGTGNVSLPKTHGSISKDTQKNKIEDDPSNFFPTPPATCQQCLGILNPEEIVIQTERGGNLALWHAQCFVCETCKELLVDLMYFFHKGKVFCGRHYAEIMNIPRCYACDELIFVKEYTCAEGETYHVRHFCCFLCDQPLGGKQYIPKDNQPTCLDCYQAKYGRKCQTCLLPIAAGEQRVSWKDLDFHVSPQCFRCTNCLKSLLGGRFVVKNDQTFCSKECVQQFVF